MARALVDELVRGGVRLAVISPGSRSAALAIASADHPGLETKVVLDERSAGFLALGRAKAAGEPAMVISTSGTAPANYLPAVIEADLSLTPLVVLSADRPAEMRGVGANQTIDQTRLFGGKVRRFIEIAAPRPGPDQKEFWRSAAAEAVSRALGSAGRPGPVHVNVAFREPTVPVEEDGRARPEPYPHDIEGRTGGRPWLVWDVPPPPPPPRIEAAGAERPLLILGDGAYDGGGMLEVAEDRGWPALATALSGSRGRGTVSTYHHLLAAGVPAPLCPDLVLAVGAVGPSLRLEALIGSAELRIRVDRWGRRLDPERSATHVIHADPVAVMRQIGEVAPAPGWRDLWVGVGLRARDAIAALLADSPHPSGASTAAALDAVPWETLVAASSLPIREVDAHLTRQGRVIANRGASGIDGFVSTARGVASAGRATVALSGDLALLHDQNGFLAEGGEDLVLVILDNEGGGLFDSLPQATHAPHYERLFVAPPHRDLEILARFHDLPIATVPGADGLIDVVRSGIEQGGLHLVRVQVDRKADLDIRGALDHAGASVAASG